MLLAVTALAGGCAQGDFGRPRQSIFESRIISADPTATDAERELDARLWRFRRAPEPLPSHFPAARLNALRDEIVSDRQLLPSLVRSFDAAGAKQDMRAAALLGLDRIDPEARALARERMAHGAAIAAGFCPSLIHRISTYRATLESVVAMSPEVEAVGAERALIALEAEVTTLCAASFSSIPATEQPGRPLLITK